MQDWVGKHPSECFKQDLLMPDQYCSEFDKCGGQMRDGLMHMLRIVTRCSPCPDST